MADQTGPTTQKQAAQAQTQPVNQPLTVACRAEGAKTDLSDGLCALFTSRLAQAHPGRGAVLADLPVQAALTLVVTRSGKGQFAARIDLGAQPGPERAMARKGAALDAAALARFLDDLIAATPGLT